MTVQQLNSTVVFLIEINDDVLSAFEGNLLGHTKSAPFLE